jgi:hypothetical protein
LIGLIFLVGEKNVNTHRTLLKIILNPILRKFRCSIVSVVDENNKFIKYRLKSYPKHCKIINKGE